jgi:hypothetical protein
MSVDNYISNASRAQLVLIRQRSKTQKLVGIVIQFLIDLLPIAFRLGLFALALFSLSTSYEFGTMTGGEAQAFRWGGIFLVCAFLNIILFKLRGQDNRTGGQRKVITSLIAPLLVLDMISIFGCTLGVNPPEMFTIGLAAIEDRKEDIANAKKDLKLARRVAHLREIPKEALTVPVAEAKKEAAIIALVNERARLKAEGIEVIKPNEVMYHVMAYASPLTPLMLQFINKMVFAIIAMYVMVMGSKYSDELKAIADEIWVAAGIKLKQFRDGDREKESRDQSAAFASLEKKEIAHRYSYVNPTIVRKTDDKAPLSSGYALPANFNVMYEAASKFVKEGGKPSVRSIAGVFYKADDRKMAMLRTRLSY